MAWRKSSSEDDRRYWSLSVSDILRHHQSLPPVSRSVSLMISLIIPSLLELWCDPLYNHQECRHRKPKAKPENTWHAASRRRGTQDTPKANYGRPSFGTHDRRLHPRGGISLQRVVGQAFFTDDARIAQPRSNVPVACSRQVRLGGLNGGAPESAFEFQAIDISINRYSHLSLDGSTMAKGKQVWYGFKASSSLSGPRP